MALLPVRVYTVATLGDRGRPCSSVLMRGPHRQLAGLLVWGHMAWSCRGGTAGSLLHSSDAVQPSLTTPAEAGLSTLLSLHTELSMLVLGS